MFSQAMLSVHFFPSPRGDTRGEHDAGSFWSADTQLSKRKKDGGGFPRDFWICLPLLGFDLRVLFFLSSRL